MHYYSITLTLNNRVLSRFQIGECVKSTFPDERCNGHWAVDTVDCCHIPYTNVNDETTCHSHNNERYTVRMRFASRPSLMLQQCM